MRPPPRPRIVTCFLALAVLLAAGAAQATNVTFSGQVRYQDRILTTSGFTGTQYLPVRRVVVRIVNNVGSTLSSSATDDSGNYSMVVDLAGSTDLSLRALSQRNTNGAVRAQVYNNTSAQAIYAVDSPLASYSPPGPYTVNLDIPVGSNSGAFNIFDQCVETAAMVQALDGTTPPMVAGYWQVGGTDGTYFDPNDNSVHLLGATSDTDEFDDPVVLHELGHFVQYSYSTTKSPGGSHSLTGHYDPRLTWSEGEASYWQNIVRNDPYYMDSYSGGVFWYEVETPSYAAQAYNSNNELAVNAVLWRVYNGGAGLAASWDVMRNYFTPNVKSILEDFWTGWFARGWDNEAAMLPIFQARTIEFVSQTFAGKDEYPGISIPDNNPTGVTSTLNVPLSLTVNNLYLYVDADHTWRGDLYITLTSPQGPTVVVRQNDLDWDSDLYTWYGRPTWTPSYLPLTAFNGQNAQGTWTLRISDRWAVDVGQLNFWRLEFNTAIPEAVMISDTVPVHMQKSLSQSVNVVVRNMGSRIRNWTQATNFKLGSQNPADNTTWGLSRVLLGGADVIRPGGQKTFTFTITAPGTIGNKQCDWQMLQEGAGGTGFLGQVSANPVGVTSFTDTNVGQFAWDSIEAIYNAGITAGCGTIGPQIYFCPASNVTRGQMAIFLIRGMGETECSTYNGYFIDVPESHPWWSWIERIYELGITAGCGGATPGVDLQYCLTANVTRGQMAIFLIRAMSETPCSTYNGYFIDVPESHPWWSWIERIYELNITTGCAGTPGVDLQYCLTDNIRRDQMAVFLQKAFNLPLP